MSRLPRTQTDTDSLLREIFRLLDAENGIDFGHYKQATVRRRIARRMALSQIECLPDYLHLLRGSREELRSKDNGLSSTGDIRIDSRRTATLRTGRETEANLL